MIVIVADLACQIKTFLKWFILYFVENYVSEQITCYIALQSRFITILALKILQGHKLNNIAIFQADHPLQVHTINIVKALEAEGYKVDLFLYNCNFTSENIHGLNNVYNLCNIHTYWSECKNPIAKFVEAVKYFILQPMKFKRENLLHTDVFHESISIVNRNKYLCFIGVEKLGFVWASIISQMFPTHILYYSLELYPTSDVFKYPLNKLSSLKAFRFMRLRQLEKISSQKC